MAPVLLAEYGVEERKGGTGGRGGAHPGRLSEMPINFLPNRLFAPAPIKHRGDRGEASRGSWQFERESADGRGDESGCAGPSALKNMLRDLRFQKAFPNKGCGRTVPRRCPRTRVLNDSSHPAASDNGEGASNLWLREYSSDKESILYFKRPPEPAASDNATTGSCFCVTRAQHPITAHTQTEKEATHSSPTVKRRGKQITDQRKQMLREGHTCFSALRRVPLD
jgi:hypothetical protein